MSARCCCTCARLHVRARMRGRLRLPVRLLAARAALALVAALHPIHSTSTTRKDCCKFYDLHVE
jgi:hypothetical protein